MPVKNFHATFIEDTKITLSWDPIDSKGISGIPFINTIYQNKIIVIFCSILFSIYVRFSFKHGIKGDDKSKPSGDDQPEDSSNDKSKLLQYEIFYKELQNNSIPAGGAFSFDKVFSLHLYIRGKFTQNLLI